MNLGKFKSAPNIRIAMDMIQRNLQNKYIVNTGGFVHKYMPNRMGEVMQERYTLLISDDSR